MAVEDDAEKVIGFAFVPIGGRIDADDAGDVRIVVGCGDLEADPPVVGHREQVIDGVEFTAGFVRIVDARDAAAELEAEFGVVAQLCHDVENAGPTDVKRDLTAVDDNLFDGLSVGEDRRELVGHVVEPAAIRFWGRPGHDDRLGQSAITGGVARTRDAEHSFADIDDFQLRRVALDYFIQCFSVHCF